MSSSWPGTPLSGQENVLSSGVFGTKVIMDQGDQFPDPPGLGKRRDESRSQGMDHETVTETQSGHNMPVTSGVDDHAA